MEKNKIKVICNTTSLKMQDSYIPLFVAALTVLILGCWNPKVLQKTHAGQPTGHPSYMWIAALSLLAGLLTCFLMKDGARGSAFY
jgi:hypothetical protein